ncbi:MAG: uncharacterized membrane protein YciS (DUF1049 family) [Natronomonas sp.]|jgi:hypothetical protein|uniref:hypothetical protein n=1 Tax=Natronomonas sp. TaxID=2184060 RepID=UPI003988AF48
MGGRDWPRLRWVLESVARLVVATLAIGLAIGGSALLLYAALTVTGWFTDSTLVQSLFALVVFIGCIAVSAYLIAIRGADEQ